MAGEVRIAKTFETLLWQDGNGSNPTGQPSVTEHLETAIRTADDATFRWHVYPSTRPKLEAEGEEEAFQVTFLGPGGDGVARDLVIARGQVLDVGAIQVG